MDKTTLEIEQLKLKLVQLEEKQKEEKEKEEKEKQSMSYNFKVIEDVLIQKKQIIEEHNLQRESSRRNFYDSKQIVSYLEPIYNSLKIIDMRINELYKRKQYADQSKWK
jgi:hypothetical protein